MKKIFTFIATAFVAFSAQAQTHILDLNQVLSDCKSGAISTAQAKSGGAYYEFAQDIEQDIFTLRATSGRKWRIENTAAELVFEDYTANAQLNATGASNTTGGRQLFVTVPTKGTLTFGASGKEGKFVSIFKANSTQDAVDYDGWQNNDFYVVFDETDETASTKTFSTTLEPGVYVLTHMGNNTLYYYVKFTEDVITAISTPAATAQQEAPAVNLAGQVVDASYKGLVVKNGRKMMQK